MKKTTIILLIIFSIFLSACNSGTSAKSEIQGTQITFTSENDFYILPGEPNEITIEAENKGSYTIPSERLQLTLKNIDPLDYNIQTLFKTNDRRLSGSFLDSGILIPGEIQTFSWEFNGNNQQSEILGLTLGVEACYDYATASTTEYCSLKKIKEDSNICSNSGEKKVSNSRAPIKLTQATQARTQSSSIVDLILTFTNLEKGTPYSLEEGSFCQDNLGKNRIKVYIDKNKNFCGDSNCMNCKGLKNKESSTDYSQIGEIQFSSDQKQTQIECKINKKTSTDSEETIRISTQYQYKNLETTQITLTKEQEETENTREDTQERISSDDSSDEIEELLRQVEE